MDTKASHLPSGDQRGAKSSPGPDVNCCGSVSPKVETIQMRLQYLLVSRSILVST
ncbi:hypothetical protein [Siminovitchia fordii]|uniref:hypothetical protein n=1 Tax=Siminovitchia fordii TaxID=254759 RepID=UPI001C65F284|nr:hypothetical protein [Siminovitchia fordii]